MGRPPWLVPVAAAYLLALLALTLLPLPGQATDPTHPFVRLRLFGTIGPALARGFDLSYQPLLLVVGNVAAFVPLGILWPLLFHPRRWWITVLTVGAGLSAIIELSQAGISLLVWYPYRQADIDDILLNTIGTMSGYALLLAGSSLWRAWKRRRQRD